MDATHARSAQAVRIVKVSALLASFCALIAASFGGCTTVRARPNANRGLFQTGERPLSVPPVGAMESDQGFSWPLRSGAVSSYFGTRRRKFHDGIDIKAPRGAPVYAAKDGMVLYSARRIRGYGNMIVLKHGDGTATVYAHNSKNLVARGRSVRRGEMIAKVGATGHATGPHLHFEIRRDQLPVDPLMYLPAVRTASQARN
ncbi:MAG: M23 family metallopeptidase [Deltaproteobacteria bacterium]|nr:M23 family metallopeptidase [Deltaproteobacteria bacterium]